MNKRRRKQRMAQKLRQLVIMERRYALVLRRLRRKIAREAAKHNSITAVEIIVADARRDISTLHEAWLRRVVDMFGRDELRWIEDRIGGKKATAYELFLNTIRAWIEFKAAELSTRVASKMLDAAKDVLRESFDKGWGISKTAREMVKRMGGTLFDNERIARTELHTAANTGTDVAARSTGLDLVKEWGATDDKRTREDHRDADGQRREMNQPFNVGGSPMMYPGDPNGPADQVINCRCTAFYYPRINGVVYD